MSEEVAKYESSLPFILFDRLDDDLIIKELEGRLPGVLTYHFNQDGQELWGLSKSGVDECSNELAKKGEVIRELECTFVDKEDEALFTVKAGRYAISKEGKEVLLDTKLGFKRQSKKTKRGNENSFWFEQGSVKACRNAASRLIPASIKAAVIEYAKAQGKVKEVGKEDASGDVPEKQPQGSTETISVSSEVLETKFRSGETNGRKWTRYGVTIHDQDGNQITVGTFDEGIYKEARSEEGTHLPLRFSLKKSPKGFDIVSVSR